MEQGYSVPFPRELNLDMLCSVEYLKKWMTLFVNGDLSNGIDLLSSLQAEILINCRTSTSSLTLSSLPEYSSDLRRIA